MNLQALSRGALINIQKQDNNREVEFDKIYVIFYQILCKIVGFGLKQWRKCFYG